MTKTSLRLFFVLAGCLAAFSCRAGEFVLHCQWASPNTGKSQTMSFPDKPLVAVLPGQNLQVTATRAERPAQVTVLKDGQPVSRSQTLAFTAPDKAGAYYIMLALTEGDAREEREVCVLVPFKGAARKTAKGFDLVVDGTEVGHYRHPSRSGNRKVRENPDSYQPPVWWFRLTPTNETFDVAPGLKAGDLLAPTEDTGLKHTDLVPVCYPMWRAVTTLREGLAKQGIPPQAVTLISGFRAPPYNRMIGSNAFGRHIYGDAFDFYIDLDGRGKAADLNRDGKLDRRDAYPVVALIEELQDDGKIPMGGIGIYNTQGGDHEVTMHLDMRGHRATWGYRTSAGGRRSEFSWASERFAELDRHEENQNAIRAAAEGRKYVRPNREPLR